MGMKKSPIDIWGYKALSKIFLKQKGLLVIIEDWDFIYSWFLEKNQIQKIQKIDGIWIVLFILLLFVLQFMFFFLFFLSFCWVNCAFSWVYFLQQISHRFSNIEAFEGSWLPQIDINPDLQIIPTHGKLPLGCSKTFVEIICISRINYIYFYFYLIIYLLVKIIQKS